MILEDLNHVELYVCPECLMHAYWFNSHSVHMRRNYVPDGECPGRPVLMRFERSDRCSCALTCADRDPDGKGVCKGLPVDESREARHEQAT